MSVKIVGTQKLVANLRRVTERVARKVLAKAVRAGGRVLVKNTKQLAPVAHADQTTFGVPVKPGLLRKSIGMKSRTRKGRGYSVVGPRRGFKTQIGNRPDGTPIYMNPTQYAHLMNNGHEIFRGRSRIGTFRGTRFMDRAFEASLPHMEAKIAEEFRNGIAQSVR